MHTHSFITMLNFLIDDELPLNVHFKASRPITNSSKWRVASRPSTTSNGEWLHVHFKALCPITTSNGEWLHVRIKTSCRMIVVSGFEPLDSFCATGSHSSYAHDVNTGVN